MKSIVKTGIIGIIFLVLILGIGFWGINLDRSPKYITILHTNDIHGRIESINYKDMTGNVGGIARRAELINRIKNSTKNVLVLDAGDFAQGTLFFNFFDGVPDVKLMGKGGYDVVVLGNHEFDKGLDVLKNMLKVAEFPFICANIEFTEDKYLQEAVKPYVIKNYNGLKVAVAGLITEDLKMLVNNLEGVEILGVVETAEKIVKKLRNEVDLIVFLTHQGLMYDVELAENVPGIDIIIGGHSHSLLRQPKIISKNGKDTLILQAGEFGVYMGKLDLKINNKKVENYYYDLIIVDESIPKNAEIKKEVEILAQELEKYRTKIIGEIAFPIGKHGNIRRELLREGTLVTKSIKHAFPDVDIVLQNSGGIRIQNVIEPGGITVADVINLFPFENNIVLLEMKGSEIKSVLETGVRFYPANSGGFLQSLGLKYALNPENSSQIIDTSSLKILTEGSRVSDVKVNSITLNPDKYYKLAINDYIYDGGNGFFQFKNGINVTNTGIKVQDAIINYIQKNSPVMIEVIDEIILEKQLQHSVSNKIY